jgi:hypothetical protein
MGQPAPAPWVEPFLAHEASDSVTGECRRSSIPEESTEHAANVDSG